MSALDQKLPTSISFAHGHKQKSSWPPTVPTALATVGDSCTIHGLQFSCHDCSPQKGIRSLPQNELQAGTYLQDPNFPDTFIIGPTYLSRSPSRLEKPSSSPTNANYAAEAISILHMLVSGSQSSQFSGSTLGISCSSSNIFTCKLIDTTYEADYPGWFCAFANGITLAATKLSGNEYTSSSDFNNRRTPTWLTSKTHGLPVVPNSLTKPDFILASQDPATTSDPPAAPWSSVLVFGEHQLTGSSLETSLLTLAAYANQVFISQPFRSAVFGVLISNKPRPLVSFWRFDRGGALGSLPLDFHCALSSLPEGQLQGDLSIVVGCLLAFTRMSPEMHGFHTTSISWDQERAVFPFDSKSDIIAHIYPFGTNTVDLVLCILREPLFVAPGIVARSTRVWKGELHSGSTVAVKYSWQSLTGYDEAKMYLLAQSRRVVGLSMLMAYDLFEDIVQIRHGFQPTEEASATEYAHFLDTHNRTFTRLVFGTTGTTILDPNLSPLQIGRALLGALIGHASLFFDGHILHRDLTPGNIIACETPITVTPTKHVDLCPAETLLYGYLIDLDYAIDTKAAEYNDSTGDSDRSGLYPFVAINILKGHETYRYRHDIESLLYVLLWVSCYHGLKPPSLSSPPPTSNAQPVHNNLSHARIGAPPWPTGDPLRFWMEKNASIVANNKIANVVQSVIDFSDLLQHFRPGFELFQTAAKKMRNILWRVPTFGSCSMFYELPSALQKANSSQSSLDINYGRTSHENVNQASSAELRGIPKVSHDNLFGGEWVQPDEIRPGLSNWDGYLALRSVFEDLVVELEQNQVQDLVGS